MPGMEFRLPSFGSTSLPTSSTATAGRIARVSDSARGLWMDQGSQWFGLSGEVVNVKEFGAVGDGVTHPLSERFATLAAAQAVYPHATALTDEIDWAAIQAALNAAKNKYVTGAGINSGGALVDLGPGTFLINQPLNVVPGIASVVFDSISIKGAGLRATWIKWTGAAAPANGMITCSVVGSGANNGAKWRDFSLHGNSVATRGIYLSGINEMTFDHLGFQGFAYAAGSDAMIYMVDACLLNTINMCQFGMGGMSANKGIYAGLSRGLRIINNEFGGTSRGSIHLVNGDVNYIAFNDFEGLGTDSAYSVQLSGDYAWVVFNRWEDLNSGIPNARSIKVDNDRTAIAIHGNSFSAPGAFYCIEIGTGVSNTEISSNVYGTSATTANIKFNAGASVTNLRVLNEINAPATHVEISGSQPTFLRAFSGSPYGEGYNKLSIGGGQTITEHYSATALWNPASIAAGSFASVDVTVTGVGGSTITKPETVLVAPSYDFIALPDGMHYYGWVKAADTVRVTLFNHTAGAVDLVEHRIRVDVWGH